MEQHTIAKLSDLEVGVPVHALVEGVDLAIVPFERGGETQVSVLYGRCLHRGALMSDGHVEGENLICGVHGWDYRIDTGVSAYENSEALQRFESGIDGNAVWVDALEIRAWAAKHPQPFDRDAYLGAYQDPHGGPEETWVKEIQELAKNGLEKTGHHGPAAAMGVPRKDLPNWDDLQIVTAQLARRPLLDDVKVDTSVVIGGKAKKPLKLDIPLFVTDMSFGALSVEAKTALAMGAELAGTGICSGEGGMLPQEQQECSRYLYELGSAKFGYSLEKVKLTQAFHFKGGQAAKTGTGGHLPGEKVDERIARVRGIPVGQAAISPATFPDLKTANDFWRFAEEVRQATGGIPIGFKLSAQSIEPDLEFAMRAGADYIILDGRGGATGAAPLIFRDHISVPTLAAVARARAWMDENAHGVSLVVTGGLRTAPDFVKALMLGADAVALGNSALQAIGCLGMRACNTNNCPVGIATQKQHLRDRLDVKQSAQRLGRFLTASVDLMSVLSRACGYSSLREFNSGDLVTWKREVADLTGVRFAGLA